MICRKIINLSCSYIVIHDVSFYKSNNFRKNYFFYNILLSLKHISQYLTKSPILYIIFKNILHVCSRKNVKNTRNTTLMLILLIFRELHRKFQL